MSLLHLVIRSLRFYWRMNLAVLLAAVVATGVLTGALAVGDSVQYTLEKTLEARLGQVQFAIFPQGRFFRAALADELEQQLGGTVVPVLQASGIITNEDGSQRVNRIQVLGVDDKFYAVGFGKDPFERASGEGVVLSESVARRLRTAAGGEVVLRIEKAGMMPRDVPLVSDEDRTVAFRLKVHAVADEAAFGRFDLRANQLPSLNVFVPLSWLGERVEQVGRANMLLVGHLKEDITAAQVNMTLETLWKPADAGLELTRVGPQGELELRTRRIFIDESVTTEALKAAQGATGILTYLVNEIRLGDKATPYSIIAAIDGSGGAGAASLIPQDMHPDEIVINEWLAEDLGAKVGDSVEITYYILGLKRKLYEERGRFKVVEIVPVDGAARDPNLMPEFPGLADAENCRDWEPGIPIDLDRIRPKDEQYWDEYRGTPKAFITLAAGQSRWLNIYGNLTAARYPWREGLERQVEAHLTGAIDPATVGLFFQPVRDRGVRAGREGTDFGELFLGLSMFLIASAVILTGLLFVFGVEGRSEQIGMFRAIGWPVRRVRRLLLTEGGIVALLGAVLGVGAGLLYTRVMIYGLSTFWSGAVAGTQIYFHARKLTLLLGGLGGLIAALFAIWVTLRRQVRRSPQQLMAGNLEESFSGKTACSRGKFGVIVAVVAFVSVAIFVLVMMGGDSQAVAGAFFGAGALLLVGTLGLSYAVLCLAGGWNRPMLSLRGLGLRNTARRSGRSLGIIGLLACGVFMVVAVGANRRNPMKEAGASDSGTGGFTLYGQSSVPILHDLSTESGRQELGLADPGLDGLEVVQFRVQEGDDASCLNLNRAQRPRLLAVQTDTLQRRKAFKFTAMIEEAKEEEPQEQRGWDLLRMDMDKGVVPAIGDYPTVFWGLGKNIGDELEYTDEMGRAFRVRIVAMLASSVLQGNLVIAEQEFMGRFPSVDGYRVFLMDTPADRLDAAAQALSSGLRDYGLVLTPTRERLAAFSAVENTYLSIFTVLGGLGLVLGSIGLGLVVLRNMFERRGELAMLRAVGFDRSRLKRMVFYEHWGLMAGGLACGVISAVVAVIPALQSPAGHIPYVPLLVTVAAIGLSGAVWVWIAGTLALRGALLDALRNE